MELFNLKRRGQTSIEFLLVFVIMLIYLQTVIQPSVLRVSNSAQAVSSIGQTKLSAMNLADSINEIHMISGESKKNVWIFIDRNSSITCDDIGKKILYRVDVPAAISGVSGCTSTNPASSRCSGEIKLFDDVQLDCSNFAAASGNELKGEDSPKALVKVQKLDTGEIVLLDI